MVFSFWETIVDTQFPLAPFLKCPPTNYSRNRSGQKELNNMLKLSYLGYYMF